MVRRYFLFFLFLVNGFYHSQQKAEDTPKVENFKYALKYHSDKNNPNFFLEERFILSIQGGKSLFSSIKNIEKDSILAVKFKELDLGGKVFTLKGVPRSKFTYYIVKENPEKPLVFYDDIGKDFFYYKEPMIDYSEWILNNEEKDIEGLKCQKATIDKYGRTFVAWFTKSIPIQDGPYKFSGLPGLIVEIYDINKDYHFTLIEYSSKDGKIVTLPKSKESKSLEVKKDKFVVSKKHYTDNLVERAKQAGLTIDENRERDIKKRLENQPSQLELEN